MIRNEKNTVEYNGDEIACVPYYDNQCISGGVIINISDDKKKLLINTPEDSQDYEIDIEKMMLCFDMKLKEE